MVDVVRVCGTWPMKFWANRNDVVPGRWYRVPDDTPALPFPHRFMHPSWDSGLYFPKLPGVHGQEYLVEPGSPGFPVGVFSKMIRYDKGALALGWRPPTHWIGTLEQWQNGSVYPANQPLLWRGGWSTACRTATPASGKACATGCPVCPLVSPIWMVDGFADFAGLSSAALVKRKGCQFTSSCAPAPSCATGTAAAWQVVLEDDFAGLTGGVMVTRPGFHWSTCCKGS